MSIVSGSEVSTGLIYPHIDSPHTEATLIPERSASIPVPARGTKRPHRGPILGSLHSEHEDDYSDFECGTPVSASWPPGEAYGQSPGIIPRSPQTPHVAKVQKAGHIPCVDAFAPLQHISQSYQPAYASNMEFEFNLQSQSFPPVAVTLPRFSGEAGVMESNITVAASPATVVRQQPAVVRTCSNAIFSTQTRGSYAQTGTFGSLSFRRNSAPNSAPNPQRVQIPWSHHLSMSRPIRATYALKSSAIMGAPDRVPPSASPSPLDVTGLQALSLTGRERETPPIIKEEPSSECDIGTVHSQSVFGHFLDSGMFQHMIPVSSNQSSMQSQPTCTGAASPLVAAISPLNVSPIVTPTGGTTPIPKWPHNSCGGNTPEHQLLDDEMSLLLGRHV